MALMYESEHGRRERAFLAGLILPGLPRQVVEEHLDELDRLVDTAGAEVVGRGVQERQKPEPATLVGRGFLSRLAEQCEDKGVDSLVFRSRSSTAPRSSSTSLRRMRGVEKHRPRSSWLS